MEKILLCIGKFRYFYFFLVFTLLILTTYICFFKSEYLVELKQIKSKTFDMAGNVSDLILFLYQFYLFSVPLTGDVGNRSHRIMYTNLLEKNSSSFSETENGFFLSFKESQYSLRRERIEEYCSKRDQKFGKKIVKSSLIYDDVDGVSYCQIAKVASSSWCNHFIKLGKLDLFEACWAV